MFYFLIFNLVRLHTTENYKEICFNLSNRIVV